MSQVINSKFAPKLPVEPMTPARALTLACLLCDFEIEDARQRRASAWLTEICEVRATLNNLRMEQDERKYNTKKLDA